MNENEIKAMELQIKVSKECLKFFESKECIKFVSSILKINKDTNIGTMLNKHFNIVVNEQFTITSAGKRRKIVTVRNHDGIVMIEQKSGIFAAECVRQLKEKNLILHEVLNENGKDTLKSNGFKMYDINGIEILPNEK